MFNLLILMLLTHKIDKMGRKGLLQIVVAIKRIMIKEISQKLIMQIKELQVKRSLKCQECIDIINGSWLDSCHSYLLVLDNL